jgi:hypothetical protein
MFAPRVRVVRCAAKTHPCPTCGKRGRRKRRPRRNLGKTPIVNPATTFACVSVA